MRKYKLVNPYLKGGISTVVESKNEDGAAEQIWQNLSKHIVNIVPSFAFTIKDTKNNKFYNYSVSEKQTGGDDKRSKNKNVEYKLKPIKMAEESVKRLTKSINKFESIVADKNTSESTDKQKGGKDKEENSDDDDSDKNNKSDKEEKKLKKLYKKAKMQNYINNQQSPIYYWWYNPLVYNVDYVYIPSFVYPISPYVQIDLGTTIWY